MKRKTPFQHTRMPKILARLIKACKKPQWQIAQEAGFANPNIISLFKSGAAKVPVARAASLARALETDPHKFLLLALEQCMVRKPTHSNRP